MLTKSLRLGLGFGYFDVKFLFPRIRFRNTESGAGIKRNLEQPTVFTPPLLVLDNQIIKLTHRLEGACAPDPAVDSGLSAAQGDIRVPHIYFRVPVAAEFREQLGLLTFGAK